MNFWPGLKRTVARNTKTTEELRQQRQPQSTNHPVSKELERHRPDLGCDCFCRHRMSAWQERTQGKDEKEFQNKN